MVINLQTNEEVIYPSIRARALNVSPIKHGAIINSMYKIVVPLRYKRIVYYTFPPPLPQEEMRI